MDNRRYNIGDKVKIVRYDPNKFYQWGFTATMQRRCGKVMTICRIVNPDSEPGKVDYRLLEDEYNYSWSILMFSPIINKRFISLGAVI